ncbi:MAG: nucleotide exchange factor GrpE, partial [Gemmatimonadaceae bacterium]|nr:nucleotide exchange factor GrpE [Gemmatimonadaceae bacterium]
MSDKKHKQKHEAEEEVLESEDAFERGAGMTDDSAVNPSAAADGEPDVQSSDEPAENDPAAVERERYLRLAAEYDNYRKRTAREKQEAESRGQADLVKQMIDPLDDIARFAHVDPATTDSVTVVQGVEMVEKKLAKILISAGLETINPVDQSFDPALHEAVATEPAVAQEDDHVVARVYQLGY